MTGTSVRPLVPAEPQTQDVPPALDAGPPKMPLWVKLLGVAVLVGVAGFLTLHLTGFSPRH